MRFEPSKLPHLLSWRSRQERRRVERVFTEIYRTGAWGSSESASGPGSTQARAADFLPGLIAAVRDLGTATLLDAPCGDFNWASSLAEHVESYVGADIVAELIERNRKRFASPRTRFLRQDICATGFRPATRSFAATLSSTSPTPTSSPPSPTSGGPAPVF